MAEFNLTQSLLMDALDFNPETGVFVWKKPTSNRVRAGRVAGRVTVIGYVAIGIYGKLYSAHRLAWLWVYGEWPKNELDHIDHNRQNNAINNLRNVTRSQNNENRITAQSNNIVGLLGVSFLKDTRKYQARIQINGKQKKIGYFPTAEEAHAAYVKEKRANHATCTI